MSAREGCLSLCESPAHGSHKSAHGLESLSNLVTMFSNFPNQVQDLENPPETLFPVTLLLLLGQVVVIAIRIIVKDPLTTVTTTLVNSKIKFHASIDLRKCPLIQNDYENNFPGKLSSECLRASYVIEISGKERPFQGTTRGIPNFAKIII